MVAAAPAPRDLAIANKQQILYWLEKRGELSPNASAAERQQLLAAYLQGGKFSKDQLKQLGRNQQLLKAAYQRNQRLVDTSKLQRVSATDASVTKTVKVLAVLIDFPDLPYNNNRLTSADSEMYYSSYPASHYQDLLFSSTGFNGPSGQNLQSANQYYQAASGGSFFLPAMLKAGIPPATMRPITVLMMLPIITTICGQQS
ncbi:immune inhibitor A domain-containing protein [Shewanella dokdonensis]|uniref:immune inhibitor A domain-containing protein n=1 Tax=Shewanella dokdonensis TaxID=712036 RepID=UPI002467D49A|nr:immune inhibitor A domain-containing protein [Shewanella dokdonensis]